MNITRRMAACALAVTLILLAPAALAAQTGAKDKPAVSGPLHEDVLKCISKTIRTDSGSEDVAKVKTCLRFYTFEPGSENDGARNYGAVWVQATVNGTNGWCAKAVSSDTEIPRKSRFEDVAPDHVLKTGHTKDAHTALVVDAAGTADSEGKIKQTYTRYPRKLDPGMRDNGHIYRLTWTGATKKKLAVVSGTEISWKASDGVPTRINSILHNFSFKKGC